MKFLSDEWIAASATPDAPGIDGAFAGRVLTIVTGGPDGEVRYVTTYADGRPRTAEPGGSSDWDVSLTLSHADARAVLDGDADLNALFMSGRMKVAGELTGPLLDLLKASKAPAVVEARAALAGTTD